MKAIKKGQTIIDAALTSVVDQVCLHIEKCSALPVCLEKISDTYVSEALVLGLCKASVADSIRRRFSG